MVEVKPEIILSVNADSHDRFDVMIVWWEIEGEDRVLDWGWSFNHGLENIYHRLMFQVTREDYRTIDVKIWDCDLDYQLIFHEDIEIADVDGTSGLETISHAHEYWCHSFDTIATIEFHQLWDAGFNRWWSVNNLNWETEGWFEVTNEHLTGDHYDIVPNDCDPIESSLGEQLGLYNQSPLGPDPWDSVTPLYTGKDLRTTPLDSWLARPTTTGSADDQPVDMPRRQLQEGIDPSCSLRQNLESSENEDWCRAVVWHPDFPPTPTPPPTNTPTPLPPTCTPYPRPTLPPSLDINIDQAWQAGARVRWYASYCDSISTIRMDWRAPGTPCPPLGIVWQGTSTMGDDHFEYYSGAPGSPPGKRACASIFCLVNGTPTFDVSVKYLEPPPSCPGWWEERVQMYHPQGLDEQGCYY